MKFIASVFVLGLLAACECVRDRRAWVFTIYAPWNISQVNASQITLLIAQPELTGAVEETNGSTTPGLLHYQGIVVLSGPMSMGSLGVIMGRPVLHARTRPAPGTGARRYAPMRSSVLTNAQYCSSVAYCRVHSSGTHICNTVNSQFCGLSSQGNCNYASIKRKVGATIMLGSMSQIYELDALWAVSEAAAVLQSLLTQIDEGATMQFLWTYSAHAMARHWRAAAAYHQHTARPRSSVDILCFWLFGSTGRGKSRIAHSLAPGSTYSWAPGRKWWDGYASHPIIVVDELRKNHLTFSDLLSLLDRYTRSQEIKGGIVHMAYHTVVITAPISPAAMWATLGPDRHTNDRIDQLHRRLGDNVFNVDNYSTPDALLELAQTIRGAIWRHGQTNAPRTDALLGSWDPREGDPSQIDVLQDRDIFAIARGVDTPAPVPVPVIDAVGCPQPHLPAATGKVLRRMHTKTRAASALTRTPAGGIVQTGGASSSSGSTAPTTAVPPYHLISDEDEKEIDSLLRKLEAADTAQPREAGKRKANAPAAKPKGRPRKDAPIVCVEETEPTIPDSLGESCFKYKQM